jgi:hypothetical protein
MTIGSRLRAMTPPTARAALGEPTCAASFAIGAGLAERDLPAREAHLPLKVRHVVQIQQQIAEIVWLAFAVRDQPDSQRVAAMFLDIGRLTPSVKELQREPNLFAAAMSKRQRGQRLTAPDNTEPAQPSRKHTDPLGNHQMSSFHFNFHPNYPKISTFVNSYRLQLSELRGQWPCRFDSMNATFYTDLCIHQSSAHPLRLRRSPS